MPPRKKKSKTRSRLPMWRSVLAGLLSPLAWKVYLLLALALAAYIVYLDATIRSSFEGKKWQLPARVYARPLELFVGLPLRADELEHELRDLGYRAGSATQRGAYLRRGERVTLFSRGHQFWDGREQPLQVNIAFRAGRIVSLTDIAGEPLPVVRLEPMEIGAIYPNHREDRILVRIEEVPPVLLAALVAVEDHRYYQHNGISIAAVFRAALENIRSGGVVQGGSTLTQQLVKNFYLTRERSFSRKFTEAIMSLLLDWHYDKERILEAYLNEVYLGQSGARAVHGFGLAAQHYFNRPLAELSIDRLALLIAIVRGPTYYDPWRYPERALKRRNLVLAALVKHQLLQSDDAEWAQSQPLNLGKKSRSLYEFPAYIDLVRRQLAESYSSADLTSNGLKIYTSFDPRVQRYAEQAVADSVVGRDESELEAAVIVVHPDTGEVLALVGGKKPRYAGFNRALDARRSIGSLVKPFVYIPALEQPDRYTLATLIDDSPFEMESAGQQWQPRNYDRKSHGEVPLVTALAHSYNQATARLGIKLGVPRVVETLHKFGMQRQVDGVPALLIGALELTPLSVAGLYQSIAANGFHAPLKAIRSVLDVDASPLQHFSYQIEKSTDKNTAYLIQQALVSVGQLGSARSAYKKLSPEFVFAGKTGTSNQQRDSWFAGYTGDLMAVVWIGRDDNAPTQLTGASGALQLWADLISKASREPLQLHAPFGIEQKWVDMLTGMPAHRRCEHAYLLSFVDGIENVTVHFACGSEKSRELGCVVTTVSYKTNNGQEVESTDTLLNGEYLLSGHLTVQPNIDNPSRFCEAKRESGSIEDHDVDYFYNAKGKRFESLSDLKYEDELVSV